MIQALAITAWMADLLTNCAFTALKINVLEANAASAMGPGVNPRREIVRRLSGCHGAPLLSIVGRSQSGVSRDLRSMIVEAGTVSYGCGSFGVTPIAAEDSVARYLG